MYPVWLYTGYGVLHQRKIKSYSIKALYTQEGTQILVLIFLQTIFGYRTDKKCPSSEINQHHTCEMLMSSISLAHADMSGLFVLLAPMIFLSAVIDEEWQRTQCSPRETCVEVASELGRSTNRFFKPPCVNVFRCGGCCNEESLICMNTSTSYVSKQVWGHQQMSPLRSPDDDSVDSCN